MKPRPTFEPLPPKEAIAALRRRGADLSPSFDYADVWEDAHQSRFTVAKSTGFDVLADILAACEDMLADGSTPREAAARLEPTLRAKGWWGRREVTDPLTGETVEAQLGSARRLAVIFDTNLRTSYAQGAWTRFEREKQTRPWLRYVALMDGRARPEHAARHNLCLPVDDPYWDRWAPPCGWGCRCTLQSLSDRDVARLQREGEALVFEAPADRMVEWLNKRTGETETIPAGIDPGWAYNPGKISAASMQAISNVLAGPKGWTSAALEAMPLAERDAAYRSWMTAMLDERPVTVNIMPIGRLPPPVAAAVGVEPDGDESWIVVPQSLPSHALREIKRARGRAPDERTLLRAPALVAKPIAILRDRAKGEIIYVVGKDAKGWQRIVVRSGWQVPSRAERGRGRVNRACVVACDRVPLETYPNPGAFDLLAGALS